MATHETYRRELGRTVLCDDCNEDFTDRADSGGIVFQSKGLCPVCAPIWISRAEEYNETYAIKARCPNGVSFADFIREYRGPNAAVTITTADSVEEFLALLGKDA